MTTPTQTPEFLKGNKTLLRTINDLYRNGLITHGLAANLKGRGLTRVSELIGLPEIQYKNNAIGKEVPFIPRETKGRETSGENALEIRRVLQKLGLDLGLLQKHGLTLDTGSEDPSYKYRIKPTLQKTCAVFDIEMPALEYDPTTPTEIDIKADKLVFTIKLQKQFSSASKGLSEEKINTLKSELDNDFQKAANACKEKLLRSALERLLPKKEHKLTEEDIGNSPIFRRATTLHIKPSGTLELHIPVITPISAIFEDNHSALDIFGPDADAFYEDVKEVMGRHIG